MTLSMATWSKAQNEWRVDIAFLAHHLSKLLTSPLGAMKSAIPRSDGCDDAFCTNILPLGGCREVEKTDLY